MRNFLLFILFLGTVYSVFPGHVDTPPTDWFLLTDEWRLTAQQWVWLFLLQLTIVLLSYIIWKEVPRHRKCLKLFFLIQVYYIIEWVLHYTSPSFDFLGLNISMQVPMLAIFAYRILLDDANFYIIYFHSYIDDGFTLVHKVFGKLNPLKKQKA